MTEMSVAKAWEYAISLIKVDGMEPTEDFKKYIELCAAVLQYAVANADPL